MKRTETETSLSLTVTVKVRFGETDALGMVWHGSYVAYLEDAREAWGNRYGLSYLDIYNNGFATPVYDMQLHYRGMASVGDTLNVEITYCRAEGAKMIFHYFITNAATGDLVLTAETTQLFMTKEGDFYPAIPVFYEQWLKRLPD